MSFKLITILCGGSLGVGVLLFNLVGKNARNMSEADMMKKFGITADHVRKTREGNLQRYDELVKIGQNGNK